MQPSSIPPRQFQLDGPLAVRSRSPGLWQRSPTTWVRHIEKRWETDEGNRRKHRVGRDEAVLLKVSFFGSEAEAAGNKRIFRSSLRVSNRLTCVCEVEGVLVELWLEILHLGRPPRCATAQHAGQDCPLEQPLLPRAWSFVGRAKQRVPWQRIPPNRGCGFDELPSFRISTGILGQTSSSQR